MLPICGFLFHAVCLLFSEPCSVGFVTHLGYTPRFSFSTPYDGTSLYFFPSLYLFRFATGIASMMQRDPVGGMESALRAQKSFWKFVGIAAISVLCLYVVIILAVVLFAGLAAARSMPGI